MTYNEAVESIRIINNLLKNDTLYEGENTELVRITKGLIHYKIDPIEVREKWVFCGGINKEAYRKYWNLFWTRNTGKIIKIDNDCKSFYNNIINPPMYMNGELRYSCICNQKIHYILFITNKDWINPKFIVIGSCCNLKFLGGYPCLQCGYKNPHVKHYCKSCICKICNLSPHELGSEICYNCSKKPKDVYNRAIKELKNKYKKLSLYYDKTASNTSNKRCLECKAKIDDKYSLCFKCNYSKITYKECIGCTAKIDSKYTHCFECNNKTKNNLCVICKVKIDDKYTQCFKCFKKIF